MKFRFRLLFVAFAVSFLLVAALSAVSIIRFSQLSDRVISVEHSYQVANMINVLDESVRELDRNEFRFLVTGDSDFFQGFEKSAIQLRKTSDSLKALTSDNATQQSFIVMFESDLALYQAASKHAMTASLSPNSVHTSAPYQNSRVLMSSATKRLTQMAAEEDRLLKRRTVERENYRQFTAAMIKALSIVFGILTLILFFLLVHEFRSRVLYQEELQQKMIELGQSKQELEHIAYATSHDLQEPLRKIRILMDKWQHQQKNNNAITDESRDTLDRIVAAATRMQDLVGDLMILTTLSDTTELVACPLRRFAGNALESLSTRIAEKKARIDIGDLPVIKGHPDQLKLLFKNLLDNALKFTRPHINPVVSIMAHDAGSEELGQEMHTGRRYHCITIKDNGIGFDNKMADKMFGIFRQLHTEREGYIGKGTGLAICQRIMSNHKGRIIAHGFPGAGATFKLYFPVNS